MKRAIWQCVEWSAWALVELAFLGDCRGPFAWSCRLGNWLYGINDEVGLRWQLLIYNPAWGEPGEPVLIDARRWP